MFNHLQYLLSSYRCLDRKCHLQPKVSQNRAGSEPIVTSWGFVSTGGGDCVATASPSSAPGPKLVATCPNLIYHIVQAERSHYKYTLRCVWAPELTAKGGESEVVLFGESKAESGSYESLPLCVS